MFSGGKEPEKGEESKRGDVTSKDKDKRADGASDGGDEEDLMDDLEWHRRRNEPFPPCPALRTKRAASVPDAPLLPVLTRNIVGGRSGSE